MDRFTTKQSGLHWLIYFGGITIFTVTLGYFACELNKLQYMYKVPIYDSMAYTNMLAREPGRMELLKLLQKVSVLEQ